MSFVLLNCLLGASLGLLLGGWGVGVFWGQKPEAEGHAVARKLGKLLEVALALQLLGLMLGMVVWLFQQGESGLGVAEAWRLTPGGWTVLAFDGLAWVMSLLVTFVGWIVCRFSQHYLAGDSRQIAYWGWLAATLASVQLMVASGNFLLLLVAWTAASLFLHRLLLYYGHRSIARRAASTKFIFSRLADAVLYSAVALLLWRSGTWELAALRSWLGDSVSSEGLWISVASLLIVLGAAIRSAQVPFHFWLPLTLDTPTPVSALMHAGIVNAGGFVAIRMSFLLVESPLALNVLAIIGLTTAVMAGLVMLTQPTVKGSLAWSTVAQMGFMLFQCGLGAFSAALLHIVAHSLYKAHAFLSSGTVIAEKQGLAPNSYQGGLSRTRVAGILLLAFAMVVAASSLFGTSLWTKSGGVVLGGVLSLGIATWLIRLAVIAQSTVSGEKLWLRGLMLASIFVLGYFLAWRGLDALIQPPSTALVGLSDPRWVVAVWALVGGWLIWNRGEWVTQSESRRWEALRVHASQGFYLDSLVRRALGGFTPSL